MFCNRLKIKQMEELKFGKQQTIGNHMYDFVCFLPLSYDKGKLLAWNEKDLFFIIKLCRSSHNDKTFKANNVYCPSTIISVSLFS